MSKKSKPYKMLIVEDNIFVFGIYRSFFSKYYDVEMAFDGRTGLDMLKSRYFDVVIADIDMPRIDGIRLVERIRQLNNFNQETIVIGLTSYPDQELLKSVNRARINAIFKTPIILKEVSQFANELLKTRDELEILRNPLNR